MKKVLITGVGGFVGTHMLAHILHNTDWEVTGIDSFRHKGKTDRLNNLLEKYPEYRERFTIITHDLKAPISDLMDVEIGHIDYVLDIASESHVDRSIDHPRPFIENNVSLVLTMLEWLKGRPDVEKFLHISTDEVFGPAYETDHPEGSPHKPSNPYAASKAAQEDICYAYWRTYNLPIIITNTMNMIGSLQETEKYIPMIIKNIQNGETINVHVSPEGVPGSRYYLHVRNQCDALLYLLNNHTPTRYPAEDIDRFNVVSEDEIDNQQMVEYIEKAMGKEAITKPQNFHESRPGHDLRYGLDGTKLKELGWKPPVSFEEGLNTTVDWYLENQQWLA